MLQVTADLESDKCYQISVTAVNEKGISEPKIINVSCGGIKMQPMGAVGEHTSTQHNLK